MPADAHRRGAHYGAEVPPAVPQTSPRTCTICIDLPRSGGRKKARGGLAQAQRRLRLAAYLITRKGLRSENQSPF